MSPDPLLAGWGLGTRLLSWGHLAIADKMLVPKVSVIQGFHCTASPAALYKAVNGNLCKFGATS